jgi:hypothetical protein
VAEAFPLSFHFLQELWFVWHNENRTVTYNNECGGANDGDWIRSPYPAGTTVKNLLYPYDEYTLDNSTLAKYANNKPPYMGCLRGIELPRFGFKVFVPDDLWQDSSIQSARSDQAWQETDLMSFLLRRLGIRPTRRSQSSSPGTTTVCSRSRAQPTRRRLRSRTSQSSSFSFSIGIIR